MPEVKVAIERSGRQAAFRALRTIVAAGCWLIVFVGCLNCAGGLVDWYMVASGSVQPGEPMFIDELAPTAVESLSELSFGVALIVGAFVVREVLRVTHRNT